ncbi:hypothetical protein D9M68_999690 [compost metagenome]
MSVPPMRPPRLRISCAALTIVVPVAPIWPRLTMLLPTTWVARSPTILLLLAMSPVAFRPTMLPVTTAPVLVRSTVRLCAR